MPYFEYLLEIKEIGDNLYDCANRVIQLYKHDFYETVPNAMRMFYECFMVSIMGWKNVSFDDYKNPMIKQSFMAYIDTIYDWEEKSFYKQIVFEGFKNANRYSHWLGLEESNIKEIKTVNDALLNDLSSCCEWIYELKTNKNVKEIFKLPIINDSHTFNEINADIKNIIKNLTAQNKILNQKVEDLSNANTDKINKIKDAKVLLHDASNNFRNEICKKDDIINKLSDKLLSATEEVESLKTQISELKISISESKDTSLHENTEFENIILEVIKYMNELGCYATVNTILNVIVGNDTTYQMKSYPKLKECKYFGYDTNCKGVGYQLNVLMNSKQISKYGGHYKIEKP